MSGLLVSTNAAGPAKIQPVKSKCECKACSCKKPDPRKAVPKRLNLTRTQAEKLRAAHHRFIREVSEILTKEQMEQWKKLRFGRVGEQESGRPNSTLRLQNRPSLRQPSGGK